MKRTWFVKVGFSATLLFAMAVATRAQSGNTALRAITLDDLFAIHPVEGPRISPEGKWVAYTVTTTSLTPDECFASV